MVTWDQRKFDSTLEELLQRSESSTWPRAINKKALFVALGALKYTERADPEKIRRELGREIEAVREDSTTGKIPIGIAIAAKRASKGWTGRGNLSGYSKRERAKLLRRLSITAWREQIGKKLNSMLRSRARSSGYLKAGWIAVIQALGPKIGGRYDRSALMGARRRPGKGAIQAAEPGRLHVIIENSSAARSEHRGGFKRIGERALKRAIDEETASMEKHIQDEMKDDFERFNRQQK